MRDGLRLVEQSLLEADVSYSVVKEFMGEVSQRALGEKVLLALDPSQQVVGIVHEELLRLLGPVDPSLHLKKDTNVLMLCGLQGSGKTTTCGKLARLLLDNQVNAMLVAADLQRPAAIDQLHVIGQQLGVPVYSEKGAQDPVKVCQDAVRKAREDGIKVVVLDTAGRLAIDQELMQQLQRIDTRVQPDQVYLVVDGMTGQDAVNSAKAFNEALELDGVIMTKLDGDARGGALLSVKRVTGVPIKFIGTGEHLDALEPFRPEGMAGRILGLGDMVALVGEVRKVVDADEQAALEAKMRAGEFTLDDFKLQLQKMSQPGLVQKMMGLMPGMGEFRKMMEQEDTEGGIKQTVGHHRFHDARGTPESQGHRSQPPQPHCPRSGRRAAGCEPAGASVRNDVTADESDGRQRHGRTDVGHSRAAELRAAGSRQPRPEDEEGHRQAAHVQRKGPTQEATRKGTSPQEARRKANPDSF